MTEGETMYERTLDRPSVGGDALIAPHTAQRCHSEPVRRLAWESVTPRPQARKTPASLCEGGVMAFGHDGGRDITRTHPRCSSVGGDALIAPHTAPAVSFRASDRCHWRGNPFPSSMFSCLRRPLFFQQRKKRGKETPPKTAFLDFLARLHLFVISPE